MHCFISAETVKCSSTFCSLVQMIMVCCLSSPQRLSEKWTVDSLFGFFIRLLSKVCGLKIILNVIIKKEKIDKRVGYSICKAEICCESTSKVVWNSSAVVEAVRISHWSPTSSFFTPLTSQLHIFCFRSTRRAKPLLKPIENYSSNMWPTTSIWRQRKNK